jgi:hypothetical protein
VRFLEGGLAHWGGQDYGILGIVGGVARAALRGSPLILVVVLDSPERVIPNAVRDLKRVVGRDEIPHCVQG